MSVKITELNGALVFNVRVIPMVSKSELAAELDGALKIRIASPPVDGAANEELIRFMAKKFGVSRSDISIISGTRSRNKRIKIANLSQSEFDEAMQ